MTIRNLEYVVHPKSLAVVGASTREGSVGRVVIENVIKAGFEGDIWPVNPKYREVAGLRCYPSAADLPGVPDLGVVVTPPVKLKAEYALMVRTDLQGRGIGWALLSRIIDYARTERIGRIEGCVLGDNQKMLAMCREFGFTMTQSADDAGLCVASLDLNGAAREA